MVDAAARAWNVATQTAPEDGEGDLRAAFPDMVNDAERQEVKDWEATLDAARATEGGDHAVE